MGVEVVRDELEHSQFDPFEVRNKQPGFVYRLLNNNERNIASKLREGYEIVKDNDPEKLGMTDSTPMKKGADVDTTQRFNDVILARIPQDKYDILVKRNRALIDRRTGMVTQTYTKEVGDKSFDARSGSGGSTIYSAQMTESEFNQINSGKGGGGKGK